MEGREGGKEGRRVRERGERGRVKQGKREKEGREREREVVGLLYHDKKIYTVPTNPSQIRVSVSPSDGLTIASSIIAVTDGAGIYIVY